MFIADDKTPCQRALCECDKKASMCFRDNGAVYNTAHKGVFAKVMSKLTKKFYKWKVESILRILLFLWVFVDWYKIALSLRQCSDGFYSNHPSSIIDILQIWTFEHRTSYEHKWNKNRDLKLVMKAYVHMKTPAFLCKIQIWI